MGPQNTGFVFLDYFCHALTLDQCLTKIIQKSDPLIFQGIFCPALDKKYLEKSRGGTRDKTSQMVPNCRNNIKFSLIL